MSQETRFSSSKKVYRPPEEEMPTRLQSIMFPRPELLTPTKKRFLPNTSMTRVPRFVLRRKSSELASERPRSSSISEIQHSLSSTVLISHQVQDPRSVIQRNIKKHPAKVAFGLTSEEKVIKSIEETQKKERKENSWLHEMDAEQYGPITLPFFANKKFEESQIEENNMMVVQMPDGVIQEQTGKIGRMRVYKSGRMEMNINGQIFQIFNGVQSTFYQEVSSVSEDRICFLGPVTSQIVIAPKIE